MTGRLESLRRLVVQAGVMTDAELRLAEAHRLKAMGRPDASPEAAYRNPLVLTGSGVTGASTAALLWRWEAGRAADFCRWATDVLRHRFGLDVAVSPVSATKNRPVEYLEVVVGGRREVVDWQRMNRDQWMGAFCAIANRVLAPLGVTALALDADEATALCFCRSAFADALLEVFPEA